MTDERTPERKLRRYRVRVRRDLAELRPCAEQLDGRVFSFIEGWVMGEADTSIYVGETAMVPQDPNYPVGAPTWIASGDLEAADWHLATPPAML